MSKQYKLIITNQNDFNEKVWEKLLNFGWSEKPQWLNDNNYINKNNIHNALSAKYKNVFSRGDDEEFISGLVLALAQLLPEGYFKSLTLLNENVQKINWESILATTTESGFDPEKNTVTTFNASSSSPSNSNDFETFTNEKASDKDISKTIDPRLSVQNIKDVSKAILDIQTTPFSGVIFNLISHPLISELFDYNLSEEDATSEVFKEIESGPKGERGEKGEKGDQGEKGEKGDTGNIEGFDLGDYYKKEEIDTRFNNIATQSVSFLSNYMTSIEINRDFLNKSVTDIQEVKSTIAGPKFINNSTTLPTGNSNELATTEYVDGKITSSGNFVESKYFQDKSELLTSNKPGISSNNSSIGLGFYGTQNYGLQAVGTQQYGFQAQGNISIGEESKGGLTLGKKATATQTYGSSAIANQQYGYQATGGINLGYESTGGIAIGNVSAAYKKINIVGDSDVTMFGESLVLGSTSNNKITFEKSSAPPNDSYISIKSDSIVNISAKEISIGDVVDGFEGTLMSGYDDNNRFAYFSTFKEIIEKTKEKVSSFVATSNTSSKIGTINSTTSSFFNGGSITAGNSVKVDFIDSNYTFTENINSGFSLIRNDTKKLDIGQSNKRVFIKVGIIVKTLTAASIGQLEIALKSGNIDLGVENIVILNPNPNAFFVKTFGILNSDLVKAEGVSITLKSQTGTFEIGGFEIILL